jgi:drug/metabolite transporter (DMT)-like permease
MGQKEILALLGSGLALAIHFVAWIYSLSLTTVASSTILVATNPIFVGLATHFILRERIARSMLAAIAITLVGSVLIGYGDIGLSPTALLGDLLALMGAIAGSGYILLGQAVRSRVSTLTYVWPCYGLAGLILLLLCLVTRQPLVGYTPQTMGILVLLAVVPQILGHSAFNWALGHFSSLLVTVALLGEPVGATILAWLILSETPVPIALAGGLLIMLGILMASLVEQRGQATSQIA